MDSVTQAALGAAVAEATIGGRRLGNKAIIWGIALGTLPDLDVLLYPFLDSMEQLRWHRGISHSLLFCVLASPLFALLIRRMHGDVVGFWRATCAVFLIFSTHVLIDVFTVYGTMVWEPFSDARIATNNLFIIDPLFTAPLLAGLLVALFLPRGDVWRMRANAAGLFLACAYTAWSFGAKGVAHAEFARVVREEKIPAIRMMSAPTPFNTFAWRGLVETREAFYVGYYSLLSPGKRPDFRRLPKNHHLLERVGGVPGVEDLRWFAEGYFGLEETVDGVIFSDWRFGEMPRQVGENPLPPTAIFAWTLLPETRDGLAVERRKFDRAAAVRSLLGGRGQPAQPVGAAPGP